MNGATEILITLDVDWAPDYILAWTQDLLDKAGVRTTVFLTHRTPLLKAMQSNSRIELGIHPNFNRLLEGKERTPCRDIIENMMMIVPKAKSVRSHSITQSAHILSHFKNVGLSHHCNTFIPYTAEIELKPFKDERGLVHAPYFWEDDVHCIENWTWDVNRYLERPGLKIFNFHPVHLYLNTENMNTYESVKSFIQDETRVVSHRNENKQEGVRCFFEQLVEAAKDRHFEFAHVCEL